MVVAQITEERERPEEQEEASTNVNQGDVDVAG